MTPLQRLIIAGSLVAALGGLPASAPALAIHKVAVVVANLSPAAKEQIVKNAALARRIDVPADVRRLNWVARRQGSCVHASTYHLLQWQGQPKLAEWWKANHGGGAGPDSIAADMQRAGIDYAEIRNGDVTFLERAIRDRRAVNVTQQGGWHMVTLVGLDDKTATILDSNHPDRLITKSRESFLYDWRHGQSNTGWAFTTLFDPPAPKPWKILTQRSLQ